MPASDDFLGEARFDITIGPARVGYLVSAGSRDALLRSIQEACTRWAGATEPILAIDKRGRISAWDRQLVGFLGIDALVRVDAEPSAAAKIAKSLQLPLVELDGIDRTGPSSYSCFPTAAWEAAGVGHTLSLPSDGSLWQATAVGSLSSAGIDTYGSVGVGLTRPFSDDIAGRHQLYGHTLIDATTHQFAEHSARGGPFPTPMILWITRKDGFIDCREFWNLRALRSLALQPQPMLLLPDEGVEHWVHFPSQLAQQLARPDEFDPDVLVCSFGVGERRRRELAEILGLVPSSQDPRVAKTIPPPPNRLPPYSYRMDLDPRVFFGYDRVYGRRAEARARLFRSSTHLELQSPVRFRHAGSALLRVGGAALSGYPRRNSIAESLLANARWVGDELLVAVRSADRVQLDMKLPSIAQALEIIMASNGIGFSIGDKGALAEALVTRSTVDELLGDLARRVVSELTTPRSKALLAAVRNAKRQGATSAGLAELVSIFGGRVERRHRTASQLAASVPGVDVELLEQLSRRSWLERGLVVTCSQCRITSFVPLAQSVPTGACPACSFEQGYKTDRPGLAVSYRLDPILDRASDQGVLPQAMATAMLRGEDPDAYLLPGADLVYPDGRRADADILGIYKTRLIVGEVKSSPAQFTASEITKDVRRAVDTKSDMLVLACPEPLSTETVVLAGRRADAAKLELLVLSPFLVSQG